MRRPGSPFQFISKDFSVGLRSGSCGGHLCSPTPNSSPAMSLWSWLCTPGHSHEGTEKDLHHKARGGPLSTISLYGGGPFTGDV
uniref:Uncharacterized protein n=1 Tax=Pyxicephalus adspersus TaxID=30357 RepID=A0AAV3AFT6_PYXAD|nr:TPA: hypothetical protein GDO54_009845 [Pyxicephalus adspersus]